jgi:hypothetical protein
MRRFSKGLASFAVVGFLATATLVSGAQPRAQAAPNQAAPMMSATDLQFTLDRLLAEHVALTGVALEKQVDNAPDYQAVVLADQQNGQQLGDFIGTLYGGDVEGAFLGAWQAHLQGYADYTQGLLNDDMAFEQQGQATLQAYVETESSLLANATGLSVDVLASDFNTHVQQTIAFVNAYVAQDYATMYQGASQAIDHMFMMGNMLAGAISAQLPQQFPGAADDSTANLRAELDNLLMQHTALAGIAEEKEYDSAPDFPAVFDALGMNTQMLAQLIGSTFGQSAAATFLPLWQAHIQDYVDYTAALRDGDPNAANAASDALSSYVAAQTNQLVGLLPNLSADLVAQMLTDHVQGTEALIQAYARGDYMTTYGAAAAGIDHMFMFGDMLAAAIAQQLAMTTGQ